MSSGTPIRLVVKLAHMDRPLMLAALRVLTGVSYGRRIESSDIDLVRRHALPRERDLDLDDLARRIVRRLAKRP
jgi:hypothetical protein